MTAHEATGYINSVFDEYFGDRCVSNTNKFAIAQDVAIKALEKQIPKDVIFVHPLQKDDGDYMCPSCKTGPVYNAYGKRSLYCSNCGQALKWE